MRDNYQMPKNGWQECKLLSEQGNMKGNGERLWRDWLTAEVLASFHLNERQLAGLALLGSEGRLTSGRYQQETRISRQTATRDLDDMMKKGILEQRGERRGAFYVKAKVMPQL